MIHFFNPSLTQFTPSSWFLKITLKSLFPCSSFVDKTIISSPYLQLPLGNLLYSHKLCWSDFLQQSILNFITHNVLYILFYSKVAKSWYFRHNKLFRTNKLSLLSCGDSCGRCWQSSWPEFWEWKGWPISDLLYSARKISWLLSL